MRRVLYVVLAAALLMSISAVSLMALQTGTWECMGYTITVTPDNPDNPNLSGTIVITKSDEYADVDFAGTYSRLDGKRPATVVNIAGTITTPDGPVELEQSFTFDPGPKKSVWKTVITWIESQIVD